MSDRSVLPSPAALRDPSWRGRLVSSILFLVLLWPTLEVTEFKPWELIDAQSLSATGRFLANFFPPTHDPEFLSIVLRATWQTVAMATTGITLSILLAIPMTLIVNEQLSISRIGTQRMAWTAYVMRQGIRWLLVLLRSVPELVWALIFVRVMGLGPAAGVLAITLTYSGMLGKVYAEIIESTDTHASTVLLQNGSSRLAAFLYGTLPNATPELISYTIYRWECAIRGSVVMGFVGAGGLGQRMDESLKMLAGGEVSTILLVFVLLVSVADSLSQFFRRNLK